MTSLTSQESLIVNLLTVAWLLPLLGFAIEVFGGYWQKSRKSKAAAGLAVACIGIAFVCSASALCLGIDWASLGHAADGADASPVVAPVPGEEPATEKGGVTLPIARTVKILGNDDWPYLLGKFGSLELSIDYYIDSLTLLMFAMVTLIATCIHIFALGYMSDELTDDHVDHEVHTADGGHFHRPGRFYRFFSFMSLFCFSMLGLVYAGNIFQVFVFWELVGICSYLLIGFYVERKSASTAANKAFIVNRVGDFGFIIGLMVIWTSFGTFRFFDHEIDSNEVPGLFSMISRVPAVDGHHGDEGHHGQTGEHGKRDHDHGIVKDHGKAHDLGAAEHDNAMKAGLIAEHHSEPMRLDVDDARSVVYLHDRDGSRIVDPNTGSQKSIPYWLLIVAGIGVFAGCIGKSAQFPLQTWLPDAMEGPTPVSALVHSATMVAAGVYLAGRFYPMFTPEVLLMIAYIGCITLFVAATIAIVATDIKRVLAYSTISQLGYMMLGIGVGGWAAGLFHLVTHAFFKSLMFLASGSVIVGCHHEQEMPRMGGLWRKMPITAFTMLAGVIAICGLAIPFTVFGMKIAFSGYHSKDAIVASALAFMNFNQIHFLLFLVPLITAGITAFYMFRLWFYTFAGTPRDKELYDHCHESPRVMTGPLIVLSLFAIFVAFGGEHGPLYGLLQASEPAHVDGGAVSVATAGTAAITMPSRHSIHAVHSQAGWYALIAAVSGTVLAYLLYGARILNPADIKRNFSGIHTFLVEKWRFDDLYDVMFVRPVHVVARWCTGFDREYIDGLLHWLARKTIDVSRWDRKFDENVIDGLVNWTGEVVFKCGRSLRHVQTGVLRQYVMFIALGVLVMFLLLFVMFPA